MEFRVELRDKSFNILEVLDNQIMGLSWEYSRMGGCGGFRFSLPRRYCEELYISGDFNVRIYIWNTTTKVFDLWYQGFVENKVTNITDNETVDVTGHGYVAQLARIQVDSDYTTKEIAREIVKDIIDTDIVPNTDILFDTDGNIVATSYTADTLTINTDAKRAIETCADIAGAQEWGVDKDRQFYFKARSTTVGFRFHPEKNISNFNDDSCFSDIVNRVIVQGGDVSGTPFSRTVNRTASQTKYGLRTKVIQNSSITTNDVADQFAGALLDEYEDVVRRASCGLVNYETRVEATIPIPLFVLMGVGQTYDTRLYDTGLYCDEIERQINRIRYSIDNNRALKVQLDLGYLRPSTAEYIARLEHELEQQRTALL